MCLLYGYIRHTLMSWSTNSVVELKDELCGIDVRRLSWLRLIVRQNGAYRRRLEPLQALTKDLQVLAGRRWTVVTTSTIVYSTM